MPLVLAIIFVAQNFLFNYWLKIEPGEYAARRLAATAALGVLLYGPVLLLGRRSKYPYLFAVSFVAAAVLSVQYLFYSYSGGFLQASALFYAGEGLSILPTVKTLLDWHLIVFAAGLLVVFGVWIIEVFSKRFAALEFFRRNSPYPPFFKGRSLIRPSEVSPQPLFEKEGVGGVPSSERWAGSVLTVKQKLVASAFIIVLVVSGYGYLFIVEKNDPENIANIFEYGQLYDVGGLVGKAGIVNFFFGDAIALAMHTDKVSAADSSFAKGYGKEAVAAVPGNDFGELKGRNVIFVQVESLDNSVIGQKINGQEITPNLNKLSGEGMYFSNYYSPIGPGTTADAEFMTMNSLYSLPDAVAFIQYPYDDYHALPGLLKDNGYGTYSMHGDLPSFWNRASIYPQLGYEKWFSRNDYVIPRKIGNYDLGDKDFFSQSLPKLASLPQPFMATLITLTSHTPFVIPDDLQTLDLSAPTNLNQTQWEYLQSVHYADQAIGDLISGLKTAGLYDNSLIMIWGDHASSTGIAGPLGVANSVFPDLQASQVPLIILAPGSNLKGNRTTPASHLDVYPTVADLLGIKPPAYVFGHDMIDGNGTVAVSRNLVSGTVKSFLTAKLSFHVGSNGEFDDGECLAMPEKTALDVGACRAIYDAETEAVKASDIMVKGNLIDTP